MGQQLDAFDQQVLEAQRYLGIEPPIAPAQLQSGVQEEPQARMLEDRSGEDWLDAFDMEVREAQETLGDDQDRRSFDDWFKTEYPETKEFLTASGESLVQLGYGAVSFLPSYGLGFATTVNEKLKNALRTARTERTIRTGGFPEGLDPTDLARKPISQQLEEAKIKTPKEIRVLAEESSGIFAEIMGEPITKGGKKVMGKVEDLMNWLFHYPHEADKKLSKEGYPNLGYLTGFAGEMILLKGMHGAAKKGKKVGKNVISRYMKTVEDVPRIKTPADLQMVDRQVNKILDDLGISEEQRIIATDKTFRAQKDVGSWMEERSNIERRIPSDAQVRKWNRKEAPSAEEIRRKTIVPVEEKITPPWEMSIDEWTMYAEKGKLRKATGKYAPGEELALTALKQGELNKYSAQDISRFYIESGLSKAEAFKWYLGDAIFEGKISSKRYNELYKKKYGEYNSEEFYRNFPDVKDKMEIQQERAPKEKEISLAEKPSVRKLNIEEQFGKRVAGEISDGIKVAEDMGIYAVIKEGVEGKRKVGEILKNVKKGRYYEEDLMDFGYKEKDLRGAIKAVKVEEFGDVKVAEGLRKRLGREAEKVTEVKEKAPAVEAEKVPSDIGRPAGVKADLKPYGKPETAVEAVARAELKGELERAPIRTAEGKLVGSQALARRLAKSRGIEGAVVRTPDGKGWYVKRGKKVRKIEEEATRRLWEGLLEEEGLGKVKLGEERGSIVIESGVAKRLKKMVKARGMKTEDVVKGLKKRGVPESEILKIFPNAFKKTDVSGTSEWLKEGQAPEDLMARRIVRKKTKGMKYDRLAPAVTRGDAHVVGMFARDLKAPVTRETYRIGTSEGLFTELGNGMKEVFLYPMRAAAKAEGDFTTRLIKGSNKLKRAFTLGTRQKHAERIGAYGISKQKDGTARLKAQGVKHIPKKLTPREQKVYDYQEGVYKELFIDINKARRAAGEQLFPPVENYSPWFHDLTQALELNNLTSLDKMVKISEALQTLKTIPTRIDRVGRTPGMKGHEKFRAGPDTLGYLHLNAFDNFNAYVKIAGKAIHIGPESAYLHELLRPKFGLAERAPNTWAFLTDWLDWQKGKEPIGIIKNPVTRRWLRRGSSNVAISYITYAFSSVLNQLSSIPNTSMLIGYPRLAEGMVKMVSPKQYRRATRESDILSVRSPEAALATAGRPRPLIKGKVGRTISDVWRGSAEFGSKGLVVFDDIVAHASWIGAEAQAIKIFKKSETYKDLSVEKRAKALKDFSRTYADDVVSRAQGSASRTERAPIQRTAEGAAMTTLQTFVIANFDLLKRQMLGIGNPDLPVAIKFQRIMRVLVGYAAVNYAFDQIGMRSPNPRPAKAAIEEWERQGGRADTEKYAKTTIAAAKELVEYIPLVGGKLKYGSEIGGPVLSELVKVTQGDLTGVIRLSGMRGFSALLKAHRASERGGSEVDIVFGRYVEPKKSGRARRSSRSGR